MLSGPDFGVYGLAGKEHPRELELDSDKYYKLLKTTILPAQRMCHEILAIFGGKVPHHMTTVPGGVTVAPTPDKVPLAYAKMKQVNEVVHTIYDYIYETLIPHLEKEHTDVVDLLLNTGVGVRNFISYGVYPQPDEGYKQLFKRGAYIGGSKPLDIDKIAEEVSYSWYSDDSGGKPALEAPPKDQFGKPGAYSWAKAPRYDGRPCEVGPLARMIVSGLYKPLSPNGASLLDRLLGRLEELKVLADKVLEWIVSVRPGEPLYTKYTVPESGEGVGLWEAPRGALGHWIKVSSRKIDRYQMVVPTTWNISPRDQGGVRGPIEEAMIGTPVPGNNDPINALRIIRSFDPCLGCAIHLITPKGEKVLKLTHMH